MSQDPHRPPGSPVACSITWVLTCLGWEAGDRLVSALGSNHPFVFASPVERGSWDAVLTHPVGQWDSPTV